MANFLRNVWYVAAWEHELKDKPLGRTLLGEPVVLYRKADGAPAAMIDRCPHRFVPLSRGFIENGELVCGYHGLAFNETGRCTSQRACDVADQFILRTYPLESRFGAIWIWMGEADRADPALIPDFSFFDDPNRVTIGQELTHLSTHYTLEVENLLDLTHVDYLHQATIAGVPMTRVGEFDLKQTGSTVETSWMVRNCQVPIQFTTWINNSDHPDWVDESGKKKDKVDMWINTRWDPASTMMIDTGVVPLDGDKAAIIDALQAHYITPETENSTHYFWSISIPDVGTSQKDLDFFLEVARKAFEEEDRPMMQAQQQSMDPTNFWAERPMILKEDAGAIRARRLLDKLLREENGQGHAAQELAAAE